MHHIRKFASSLAATSLIFASIGVATSIPTKAAAAQSAEPTQITFDSTQKDWWLGGISKTNDGFKIRLEVSDSVSIKQQGGVVTFTRDDRTETFTRQMTFGHDELTGSWSYIEGYLIFKGDMTTDKVSERIVDGKCMGGSTAEGAATGAGFGFLTSGPAGAVLGGLTGAAGGMISGMLHCRR